MIYCLVCMYVCMYVRSRLLQLTPPKVIQRASNGNELIRQSPPTLLGGDRFYISACMATCAP